MNTLAVVILAAGQGTRMQSNKQKILHEVGGRPMVAHVFEAADQIADLPPLLVVGPGEEGTRKLFGERAGYVTQPEQLGTGHATMMAAPLLEGRSDQVLVAYGDMPLLRAETMRRLSEKQSSSGAAIVMLSVMGDPSSSFGRIVRVEDGRVNEIVEVAEARQRPDPDLYLSITELNAGVYCFDGPWLWQNIQNLPLQQARSGQEYYLTDMIGLAVAQGKLVEAIVVEDDAECLGAGTRAELVAVEKAFRERANEYWLANGVTLVDPTNIYLDQTITIGPDTVIWPNTFVQGDTIIGRDCVLGPNTIIRDSRVGDGCHIEQAVVERSVVEPGTIVQPFSHLQDREAEPN
jgi:bifunctional UDP-N-acetylglucosamine pyrophosphorylase/glucosamine-1-phosphate N-acetyltransferase